jgi:acyl carrier protein phosphodiesterase
MNFLAHARLSGSSTDILTGNMIGDYVKGRQKDQYPEGIRKGIELHRSIDSFTDHHPAVLEAVRMFRPYYRLYSGALTDILFDHYLSHHEWVRTEEQNEFVHFVYTTVNNSNHILPENFQTMFQYMKKYDWLNSYRDKEGIERAFRGMSERLTFNSGSQPAIDIFVNNYSELNQLFHSLYPDLKHFVNNLLSA